MTVDYTKLIDRETWAFIERTNGYYPPNTVDFSIPDQRAIYDRMCREFFVGYPEGVTAVDGAIADGDDATPIRTYSKAGAEPGATVLFFHGGGFILGDLESHDDVCAELCDRTGFNVTAVDYRLAPEHLHPAAFDDCLSAFEWLAGATGLPIVLVGDSAGGCLAAAVSHATRGRTRSPAGQVLIYPGLGGDPDRGSHIRHADAPMLTRADVIYYRDIRSGGNDVAADPTFAPLSASDFSGLPPTVVISAECDPLSDDGRDYCEAIRKAGGQSVWFNEVGLVHGYLRARHSVPRARESFKRIVQAASALGRGEWPY